MEEVAEEVGTSDAGGDRGTIYINDSASRTLGILLI